MLNSQRAAFSVELDTCRFDPLDSKLLQIDHWRLPMADPAQWLWEKKHIMMSYYIISYDDIIYFLKCALQSKDMINMSPKQMEDGHQSMALEPVASAGWKG